MQSSRCCAEALGKHSANEESLCTPLLSVSGEPCLFPTRVFWAPAIPPAQRAACLCHWWHSSRKLCRREDELLLLAAEDHLPVLDKEEEQQPWHRPALLCQGSPGSPGCSVDRWPGWGLAMGRGAPRAHRSHSLSSRVTRTHLRQASLESFHLGCFGL